MGLGRREARHETVAAAKTAGVDSSAYWEYQPGQKVMTRDGYPGKVLAVHDGPFAGNEEYEVVLDHGLGGGAYTASLLQPFHQVESKVDVKTAADDYPELGTILEDRPPLARATSSLTKQAWGHEEWDEKHDDHGEHKCSHCGDDHFSENCPEMEKTSAYDHGDLDAYTAPHKCPSCGKSRALESATGVIKCEDCGYEEQNGDKDGYGKTATLGDLDFLVTATADSEFRFHVTATFAEVRTKAKRLRAEGGVNIISASAGTIAGNIKGDHHVYETVLTRHPNQPNSVAQWGCGCKWAAYSWGRTGNYKRFEGRMCSHALALQFEAQSRGMFGRQVDEDQKAPSWLKPRTRVVVEYDRDSGKNQSRPAQPRKRDLQRTYASVDASVAPVTLLCMLAVAQGASYDDLSLALESAGINATAFLIEAKDLPGSDQDAAKHRHKGDQMPCSRAGCGHPDGIHGDNGATCLSQGCDCRKFTTTATDDGQTETDDEGSSKREGRRQKKGDHHGLHGGEYPMRGGFGYGYGYLPYFADYDNGHEGVEDNDADDGGSGDSDGGGDSGGGGTTGSRHTAFYDTMDPTYTEGNDVRQNPNGNGLWNATKPANPNDNPGSTGWAATGDPKEFSTATDNDAAGRLGSLNVESVFAGLPPVEAGTDLVDRVQRAPSAPDMSAFEDQFVKPKPPTFKPPQSPAKPGANGAPRTYKPKPEVKTLKPVAPEAPAKPTVPGPRTVPAAPAAPEAPKPGGFLEDLKGVGGEALSAADEAGNTLKGLLPKVLRGVEHLPGGTPDMQLPPGVKPQRTPLQRLMDGNNPFGTDPVEPFKIPNAGGGADWKGPAAPAPAHPQVFAPAQTPAWATPTVPGTPGHTAPVEPAPQHGIQTSPQLQTSRPSAPTGTTPRGISAPQSSPKDPQEPKKPEPKKPNVSDEGEGGRKPRIPKIPLPGLWHPDYLRASDLLRGQGIGSKGSLANIFAAQTEARTALAALTPQQEFANGVADNLEDLGGPSLHRYEAELHDEPEAALPSTDGERDDPTDDDVEGMQAQGSVEDIVAQFQATAGASSLMSGSSALPEEGGDVAAAAKAFLQTEAMKTFSPGEQRQIIDEGKDVVASNLDRLDIKDTHYAQLEAALAASDTDDDGDLWS